MTILESYTQPDQIRCGELFGRTVWFCVPPNLQDVLQFEVWISAHKSTDFRLYVSELCDWVAAHITGFDKLEVKCDFTTALNHITAWNGDGITADAIVELGEFATSVSQSARLPEVYLKQVKTLLDRQFDTEDVEDDLPNVSIYDGLTIPAIVGGGVAYTLRDPSVLSQPYWAFQLSGLTKRAESRALKAIEKKRAERTSYEESMKAGGLVH